MMATAYAKSANGKAVIVQALEGGLAPPGDPLRGRPDSFEDAAVLEAGRLQAAYLNQASAAPVAGGRLPIAVLRRRSCHLRDPGPL